jgi:hypothetical protein
MGAGFLVLVSLLLGLRGWLRTPPQRDRVSGMGPRTLAWLNTRRNPRRTLLTVGLIAVATFLIVAISSFRLRPKEDATGGLNWIAESAQPIFADLSTPAGQDEVLGQRLEANQWRSFYSLRVKTGQDASCNNLYQATQPKVSACLRLGSNDSTKQGLLRWLGPGRWRRLPSRSRIRGGCSTGQGSGNQTSRSPV